MAIPEARPAIRVRSLTKSIATSTHTVNILRGLDFEVPPGEFVAIMGASGSGKSTLLGLLAGLQTVRCWPIQTGGGEISRLGKGGGGVLGFTQRRLCF